MISITLVLYIKLCFEDLIYIYLKGKTSQWQFVFQVFVGRTYALCSSSCENLRVDCKALGSIRLRLV